MKKATSRAGILTAWLTVLLFAGMAVPALAAAAEPIATLTGFSGSVVVRSQGDWGAEPKVGMTLYPEDRVVTRDGTAVITFEDGGRLELSQNSNAEIQQWEEKKGFFSKTRVLKRRIFLFLGRLNFRSGNSGMDTSLATPTAVCGLRGTAGVLSVGADGEAYITFSEGGTSYKVGDFLSGVAAEVPQAVADMNPIQRAAFVAKAAAMQVKNAEALAQQATGGDRPEEQKKAEADLAAARALAAQKAAEVVQTTAQTLAASNSDPVIVEQALAQSAAASQAIQDAQGAYQQAVDAGATVTEDSIPQDPAVIAIQAQQQAEGGAGQTGEPNLTEQQQQQEADPEGEPSDVYEPPEIDINEPTFDVTSDDTTSAS